MSITEKIDQTTKIPLSHLSITPPPPRSAKVEISGRCSLACQFCSLPSREKQPKQDIDFDLFCKLVRDLMKNGVHELGLFYIGSSEMNPELLIRCAKYAKDQGMPYTFLTSNAVMLTPMLFGELSPYLDSLKWSVNCANERQWTEVTRTKPALFHKALDNIKACWEARRDQGLKTKLYASSILYDGEQQARLETLLNERVRPYVDEWYALPLFREMQNPNAAKNIARGWKPNAGNQGRVGALRDALPCWACFSEAHIRVDGGVSACCFGSDDRFDMGNLNDMPFMEAWNSKTFQELRRKHLEGDVHNTVCESCIYG